MVMLFPLISGAFVVLSLVAARDSGSAEYAIWFYPRDGCSGMGMGCTELKRGVCCYDSRPNDSFETEVPGGLFKYEKWKIPNIDFPSSPVASSADPECVKANMVKWTNDDGSEVVLEIPENGYDDAVKAVQNEDRETLLRLLESRSEYVTLLG
ncbi:hypothetical protein BJ508DRAFT_307925 [Ascobolus immersus RN42]|uniref:Uncharacterized protein n=1 Tax=Ascobolus immersus RN42 TaxID=1160509 RepID=A0A3N4I6L2_ASCIM|nr:hypothetical protein BJ508DRAFT_307925 [Ascobolus immersus RN42]